MRTTISRMNERDLATERRPLVKPTADVWEVCIKFGKKYDIGPLEVLKRLVQIGLEVAEIEEMGGEVIGRKDSSEIGIKVFKK